MKNQITLLCLDLGSELGWAKCTCNLRPTFSLNVPDHGTVKLESLTDLKMKLEYNDVYDRARFRMVVYEETIRKLVNMAKFDCFVAEAIFCNPSRISAFQALIKYTEVLERIVNVEQQRRLYSISPASIKKYIDGYGGADKARVRAAVLSNPDIKMRNPHSATEHEFDAVATGYAFMQEFLVTLT